MDCTIYNVTNFIGKRWTLLIILEIYKGDKDWKRYSDIKKGIVSITPKLLSQRLKELEHEKIILKKTDSSSVPIRTEYSLTESGKDFVKVIQDMKKWAIKHKPHARICENTDCKGCVLGL